MSTFELGFGRIVLCGWVRGAVGDVDMGCRTT